MDRIQVYSVGICHASVCAESNVKGEEVVAHVNRRVPTGVGPWEITEKTFASGEPNPCLCNSDPGRFHWLVTC